MEDESKTHEQDRQASTLKLNPTERSRVRIWPLSPHSGRIKSCSAPRRWQTFTSVLQAAPRSFSACGERKKKKKNQKNQERPEWINNARFICSIKQNTPDVKANVQQVCFRSNEPLQTHLYLSRARRAELRLILTKFRPREKYTTRYEETINSEEEPSVAKKLGFLF